MNDKKRSSEKNSVANHYDASAANYHIQYERNSLTDLSVNYPANYFRMQLLINSFVENDLKKVIEVGVGEGTPLANLLKSGIDVSGFDIGHEMVKKAKQNIKKYGGNEDQIVWGDIQDPSTYVDLLRNGKFDGLIAMGVMPHVRQDEAVLKNMRVMVRPGGRVFVEFRNSLFSLFTFNRNTHDFIVNELLDDVAPEVRSVVSDYLKNRLEMEKPTKRLVHEDDSNVIGYDAILSKFHNPFEITALFEKCGFDDINLLWYHYHPAMPILEEENRELFRNEALKLEHNSSNWKGLFLCSAFVVEARRAQ